MKIQTVKTGILMLMVLNIISCGKKQDENVSPPATPAPVVQSYPATPTPGNYCYSGQCGPCPVGQVYNSALNQCTVAQNIQCPSGTTWNGQACMPQNFQCPATNMTFNYQYNACVYPYSQQYYYIYGCSTQFYESNILYCVVQYYPSNYTVPRCSYRSWGPFTGYYCR